MPRKLPRSRVPGEPTRPNLTEKESLLDVIKLMEGFKAQTNDQKERARYDNIIELTRKALAMIKP